MSIAAKRKTRAQISHEKAIKWVMPRFGGLDLMMRCRLIMAFKHGYIAGRKERK